MISVINNYYFARARKQQRTAPGNPDFFVLRRIGMIRPEQEHGIEGHPEKKWLNMKHADP